MLVTFEICRHHFLLLVVVSLLELVFFVLSVRLPAHLDPPCQLDILVFYKKKKVRIKSEEK